MRPAELPPGPLPFSPAALAGGFLFVSGQASVGLDGRLIADTFAGEMRRSFDNVARILAAAGLDWSHVVQVKSYVRDPADLPEYNRLYREWLTEPYPARSTLTNCLPVDMRYEIDVIAYAGQPSVAAPAKP